MTYLMVIFFSSLFSFILAYPCKVCICVSARSTSHLDRTIYILMQILIIILKSKNRA